uniref:MLLT3 super elongation complex subunit n=1 Tax=Myripristis murdjan TaxID=586833 RepID=A0A667Y742_9TELE
MSSPVTAGAVQVKLELGHRAQVRKKPTVEGFTHDWMVFVRGPEHSNIQHFVEKVVFHLHESFPRPKRVCKDPPYKVEESGYAGPPACQSSALREAHLQQPDGGVS